MLKVDNVILDMDGTLTHLNLPFDEIKKALDVKGKFILEEILSLDQKERTEKLKVLKKFEIEAAKTAELKDEASELLESLRSFGIKRGIVTRNCYESVKILSKRFGVKFDYVVSRESTSPKPSPHATLRAIIEAKSTPQNSISVGDFKFDLLSAKLAGVRAVLLITERNRCMAQDFQNLADYTIESLKDVQRLLGLQIDLR
jgi:HAD superfamily hydrolase (TIGR01509 family)